MTSFNPACTQKMLPALQLVPLVVSSSVTAFDWLNNVVCIAKKTVQSFSVSGDWIQLSECSTLRHLCAAAHWHLWFSQQPKIIGGPVWYQAWVNCIYELLIWFKKNKLKRYWLGIYIRRVFDKHDCWRGKTHDSNQQRTTAAQTSARFWSKQLLRGSTWSHAACLMLRVTCSPWEYTPPQQVPHSAVVTQRQPWETSCHYSNHLWFIND